MAIVIQAQPKMYLIIGGETFCFTLPTLEGISIEFSKDSIEELKMELKDEERVLRLPCRLISYETVGEEK